MKLIDKLYLAFYRYSLWNKENKPSSYIHERLDSILVLSFLTTLNFSTIIKLFHLQPFFTTHLFDCFLAFFLIIGLLYLNYDRNSKYKRIGEKYKNDSVSLYGWTYTIVSVVFFYIMF